MISYPGIGEIVLCSLILFIFFGNNLNIALCGFLVLGLLIATFLYFKKLSSVWSSQKVPGPRALPFLGNPERIRQGNHVFTSANCVKYGNIWGGFQFMVPELFVSDIEVIKQVLVKQTDIFTNRQTFRKKDVCDRPNPSVMDGFVSMLHDERWKYVRRVMAPTFTMINVKHVLPNIQRCVDTLVKVMEQDCNENYHVDIKKRFSRFTVAVMSSAGFGIDVDCQENMNDPILDYCHDAFDIGPKTRMIWFMALFPWISLILKEKLGFTLIFADGQTYFTKWFKQIIQQRRNESKYPPDFLQYMMNAAKPLVIEEKGINGRNEGLTEFEIICQMVIFILSGSESSGGCLTFMAYLFAMHPDVQEKCYQEVLAAFGNNEALEFEDIQTKLKFLEACLNECLRMYPPCVIFDREASRSVNIKGITIPKGGSVVVPVYYIHHSEEFYKNPENFIPERFLPDQLSIRDPKTFLPFGYGPRNCIGARFAMIEMKLCYANLLRKYCFLPCEQTKVPLPLESTGFNLQAKSPILLKLQKRNL